MELFFVPVLGIVAGFFLGFLALYTIRRRHATAKPASQEMVKNTEQTPCLWCGKKEYSAANPSFTCPKCGTVHHRSCWDEYGGCTTWECSLAPTTVEEATRIVR